MRPIEVSQVIRLVSGYWPHPSMTDDEIRVWTMKLSDCDSKLAVKIIESFATSGRDFRPTAGQFVSEYTARVPRSSGRVPETAGALPANTEHKSTDEWRETIQRQLEGARGPMRDRLGSITQGLEIDPLHPFPESVHERGMAYARRLTNPEPKEKP